MRLTSWLLIASCLASAAGCGRTTVAVAARQSSTASRSGASAVWEVAGKTQPVPGCIAQIAPVVLHPVEEVFVVAGQRVKKDDKLVRIDDDEPRADLRAREATLKEMEASLERLKRDPRLHDQEEARATLEASCLSREYAENQFKRMRPLWRAGAVAEQRYHESLLNRKKSQADQRAAAARLEKLLKRPFEWEINEAQARIHTARANVDSAKAELEHYLLQAPISGVISWLDVHPGTVSRPGTSLWGEILDLRQIDVRCDLTPQQADRVVKGQRAEVATERLTLVGKVVMVGIAADRQTGLVPVLVRLANANERLRCYVPVKVRFANGK
jgi:multidrug resistance efflux pump